MKSLQIVTVIALLAFNTIQAQTIVNTPEKPYIEVNGTAEKEVVPDEIYIRIIIREKTENRDKTTVEQQEIKLKEAIKGLGISLDKLTLTDANADYLRVGWGKREVVEKKDFTLMVSDAKTVGLVFQKLDELEIREANIERVNHSKIEEFQKEMKIKAIKAAKEKADYLTAAIGEKLGSPQIIRDNMNISNTRLNYKEDRLGMYNISGVMKQVESEDVIQFQKIRVTSSIYVKFEIQ